MNSFSDLQNNKMKLCNPISSMKKFFQKKEKKSFEFEGNGDVDYGAFGGSSDEQEDSNEGTDEDEVQSEASNENYEVPEHIRIP